MFGTGAASNDWYLCLSHQEERKGVKFQILIGHLGSQGATLTEGTLEVVSAHLTILCPGEKGAGAGGRGTWGERRLVKLEGGERLR